MRAGMGVIDGGATRTLGSVQAVERLLELNQQTKGTSHLLDVNPQDKPTFSFRNASENRCLSTVRVGVSAGGAPGELSIHTLDCGGTPILVSIDTLRRLGAVIDFRDDLMVLRALDAQKIIPLQRSAAGHQLLSLTQDLYSNHVPAARPVPGLKDFI